LRLLPAVVVTVDAHTDSPSRGRALPPCMLFEPALFDLCTCECEHTRRPRVRQESSSCVGERFPTTRRFVSDRSPSPLSPVFAINSSAATGQAMKAMSHAGDWGGASALFDALLELGRTPSMQLMVGIQRT